MPTSSFPNFLGNNQNINQTCDKLTNVAAEEGEIMLTAKKTRLNDFQTISSGFESCFDA